MTGDEGAAADYRRITSAFRECSPVGIFPAVKFPEMIKATNKITDRKWQYQVLRMIRNSRVQ